MYRFNFLHLLSILIVIVSGHPQVQAQEVKAPEVNSLRQQVEARNSIAKYTVSLSPTQATVGEEVTLSIQAVIEEGWHIGATVAPAGAMGFATQIQFDPSGLESIESEFVPSAEPEKRTLDVGTEWLMAGEFSWTRKYRVIDKDAIYGGVGTVRFQACNDVKCLPPETVTFNLGGAQTSDRTSSPGKSMKLATEASLTATEKVVGSPMVLSLEPSELTRTRPQLGLLSAIMGRSKEKLVWKGTIQDGPNTGVAVYLPKANKYSLHNTGADGTNVNNTATYVSVDQNGDGELADWEAAAVDRPVRIRDTMYRVMDINPKDKTLTLQQLDIPLKGSLIGFRCPDFEFTALDGSVISNKSILGKTTVLDVWAVSCHNCYEGFPNLQRSMDKYTADKLQVILFTVDTNRQMYESVSAGIFKTYGGAEWPQVMVPSGFDGALAIGNYGFGSVIVDDTGIVRAIGVHGRGIEPAIDEVMTLVAKGTSQPEEPSEPVADLPVSVTLARETLADCFPGLSDRLDALRAKNELLTKQDIEKLLAKPSGLGTELKLPAPANNTLSPVEIASRLRNTKLHVGWFFKCNNCDSWHLNFGGGFPVAEGGVIATCYHVVMPPPLKMNEGYFVVMNSEGRVYKVESVIAADEAADCALIKVADANELMPLPLNLTPVIGSDSYVLSNPLGMSDYFSNGLVNRIYVKNKSTTLSEIEMQRGLRINVGADWAPGSSGSPIVDSSGNLIGYVCAARGLMGPTDQAVQSDGKTPATTAGTLTTFFTVHEAGTATAVQMLIDSLKR